MHTKPFAEYFVECSEFVPPKIGMCGPGSSMFLSLLCMCVIVAGKSGRPYFVQRRPVCPSRCGSHAMHCSVGDLLCVVQFRAYRCTFCLYSQTPDCDLHANKIVKTARMQIQCLFV